jgi:hypothetical protein
MTKPKTSIEASRASKVAPNLLFGYCVIGFLLIAAVLGLMDAVPAKRSELCGATARSHSGASIRHG